MATRRPKKTESSVEVTEVTSDEVYMSKYDKISEEKFAELEKRIADLEKIAAPGAEDAIVARLEKLERFEEQAKGIKGWFPAKWL